MAAIEDAQTDYPGHAMQGRDERRVATRGDLAVVYAPRTALVVTVLWNGKENR